MFFFFFFSLSLVHIIGTHVHIKGFHGTCSNKEHYSTDDKIKRIFSYIEQSTYRENDERFVRMMPLEIKFGKIVFGLQIFYPNLYFLQFFRIF